MGSFIRAICLTAALLVPAAAGCQREEAGAGARTGGAPAAARGPAPADVAEAEFQHARGERAWTWPRDHGAHPAFATEWWYTTGVVRTDEGRRLGYELTFFRQGLVPSSATDSGDVASGRSPWRATDLLLAHAAVTDETGRRFVARERLARAAHGWAGADTTGLDVWIDDWRMRADGGAFLLRVPPESTGGELGLDLRLTGFRPPVLHGEEGLSRKDARPDAHASWYVSLPRLETDGTLTLAGESFDVRGFTWLDHEFFSGGLEPGLVGWDWFSVRLEDGRDLMLFRLRDAAGETRYASGTVTSPDGVTSRPLDARGAVFEPLERWRSPATGAQYPVAWRVRMPVEALELVTRTPLREQEIAAGEEGFTYWEGLVDVSGEWRGDAVRGEGYVEMTGYDAPIELR